MYMQYIFQELKSSCIQVQKYHKVKETGKELLRSIQKYHFYHFVKYHSTQDDIFYICTLTWRNQLVLVVYVKHVLYT